MAADRPADPTPRTAAGRDMLEWEDDPRFHEEARIRILAIEAEAARREAGLREALEALRVYALHYDNCAFKGIEGNPCSCGFDAALDLYALLHDNAGTAER